MPSSSQIFAMRAINHQPRVYAYILTVAPASRRYFTVFKLELSIAYSLHTV
jgi:hypothetical protein